MKIKHILLTFILLCNLTVFSQKRTGFQDYTTVTALRAETITPSVNDKIFLKNLGLFFYWDNASIATDDGANTIKQASINIGRWIAVTGGGQNFAPTFARVNALANLTNTTYLSTGIGTKVPFNNEVYRNGMTLMGTNGIIPSASGRYRVSWLLMAGSEQFAGNGYVNIVQNSLPVGEVLYNMMEAAGVNQSAGFIDVDLVSGQEVNLYFRSTNGAGDALAWDAGSYFDILQVNAFLPVSLSGILPIENGGTGTATGITADNGLTEATGNIQLGGTLIQPTNIVTGSNDFNLGDDAGTGIINIGTGGSRVVRIGSNNNQFTSNNTTAVGTVFNSTSLTTGIGVDMFSSSTTATGQLLRVISPSTGLFNNGAIRFQFTGNHTGQGLQIDDAGTGATSQVINSSATTGQGLIVNAHAITNGSAMRVISNSTAFATGGGFPNIFSSFAQGGYTNLTGSLNGFFSSAANSTTNTGNLVTMQDLGASQATRILDIYSASTNNQNAILNVQSQSSGGMTQGGVRFNFAGTHSGQGFQIDDATTLGTVQQINANAVTTGKGLVINANSLTSGSAVEINSNAASTLGNGLAVINATATLNSRPAFSVFHNGTGAFTAGQVLYQFGARSSGAGILVNDASVAGTTLYLSTALTTGNGIRIGLGALTTGSAINIATGNTTLNSTNGLLYVANTGTSTNGILARFQSNSTATSGLTVRTSGNVGVNTTTPASNFEVAGTLATLTTNVSAATITLATNHTVILTFAGLQTVTLPSATGISGREYIISNATNTIKAFASAVTNLDGTTTTVIPPSQTVTIRSDGTVWRIIYGVDIKSFVRCAGSAATQAFSAAPGTTLTNWTELQDNNNNFAAGIFTSPRTGYYQVSGQVWVTSSTMIAGARLGIIVSVNNSTFGSNNPINSFHGAMANPASFAIKISELKFLNAGDTIRLNAFLDNATAANTDGNANFHFLTIAEQ